MNDVAWVEAATIGTEAAHATWALAARMLLEERAATYHGTVGHEELAQWCQERTRIRGGHHRHWLGDVLWRVMEDNHGRGEPFLSSLAVSSTGQVWSGYAGCVAFLRGGEPADADDHGAHERLACYRRWAHDLPEDGGVPGPRPVAARVSSPSAPRQSRPEPRERTTAAAAPQPTRVARSDVQPKICPTCFMALPASGQCDTCD